MGDLLDDILDLKHELKGISDEVKSVGDEMTGAKSAVRTEVKRPWNPAHYADKPTIAYDQCCRHRYEKSACNECEVVCPTNALTFDEGDVVIDMDICAGCGLCATACPTDALALTRFNPKALATTLEKKAQQVEICYVTCSRVERKTTPDARILVLPCLAVLTREVLFALLGDKVELAVYMPVDACENCEWGACEQMYAQAIEDAELWSARPVGFECDKKSLKLGPNRSAERRDFVTSTATALGSTAIKMNPMTRKISKVTDMLRQNPIEALGAKFGAFTKDDEASGELAMGGNRALLLWAIDKHRIEAERIKVCVSKTLDDKCTGCKECVKRCPTGARRMVAKKAVCDKRLCMDCGLCAEVCESDAIGRVRVNGRTLVGLSAHPNKKVNPKKVAADIVPSAVKTLAQSVIADDAGQDSAHEGDAEEK